VIRIAERCAPRDRREFRLETWRDHLWRKLGGAIGHPGSIHRDRNDHFDTVFSHATLHPHPLQM